MCGIVGLVHYCDHEPVSEEVVRRMCRAIIHRGPDDEGIYLAGRVGLGMRRLSIIDLTTGQQPIHNEDKTIWVVFNGEIYNYPELRDHLVRKGHTFYTQSDTEVIVHLYEETGVDCFQQLNGMFAIAIWDAHRNQLVLGRDRLGKKPLYYSYDGSRLLFASELKSMLCVPGFQRQVSLEALDFYLSFGCVPGDLGIFQGVQKLPAGHTLVAKAGGIHQQPYWHLAFGNSTADAGETFYLQALRELVFDAVKRRLISDVPLGAFLSGGVDSSTVVAVMAKLGVKDLKTFSIGFEEEGYSELSYAREVAEFLGTKHYELIVQPDMVKLLPELVWYYDEPFADSSAIPTYYVSQLARSEVTVVLSGDGGDELFGGYTRYLDPLLARMLQAVPETVRLHMINRVASHLPRGVRGRRWLTHTSSDACAYYASKLSIFDSERKTLLYARDMPETMSGQQPLAWLRTYFGALESATLTTRRQYTDIKTYLPDTILTKVDRASMAVSLEARAPLLDYRIAEFAGKLPDHYKIRNGQTKYLLKALARSLLPESIVNRRKKGFSIPKHVWLQGQLREFCADILLSSRAKSRGYFNTSYVEHMLREQRDGRYDFSDQIWALLCLELWHLRFVDWDGEASSMSQRQGGTASASRGALLKAVP
jgi:asparagine synthase (glutamine-hydrolysing)